MTEGSKLGQTAEQAPSSGIGPSEVDSIARLRRLNAKNSTSRHHRTQPYFKDVDIDQIRYHRFLHGARLRAELPMPLAEPKSGVVLERKFCKVAYKRPIQVTYERGDYWCFGGTDTLEEARVTLTESRMFPVLVHPTISEDELLEEVLIDQIWNLLHGLKRSKPLKKSVELLIRCAIRFPQVFGKHTKSEWARLFGCADRSFGMPRAK
jgi:hypothetical protein